MDTLRALAPPDGLSFTPLFNQPLSSDSARITRLEHAVQTLSDDINTMAPTVVRMVAIEGDVKGLVKQLQTLTNQNQQSASGTIPTEQQPESPPASAGGKKIPEGDVAKGTEPAKADEAKAGPVASSSLVTPEAASKGQLPPKGAASPISKSKAKLSKPIALTAPKAPPANAVSGSVVNMRIGDWPHKTRLVLDVTAKIPVKMRMINHNKTLVIDLAYLRWGGRDVWASDHTQLITDGHVKDGRLYVNLKRASTYKSLILSPSRSDKNFRLVIDLFDKGL